jgi:hypothetical protein
MKLHYISCPRCGVDLSSKAGIDEGTCVGCPQCKRMFVVVAPVDRALPAADDDGSEEGPRQRPKRTATAKDSGPLERADPDDDRRPRRNRRARIENMRVRLAKKKPVPAPMKYGGGAGIAIAVAVLVWRLLSGSGALSPTPTITSLPVNISYGQFGRGNIEVTNQYSEGDLAKVDVVVTVFGNQGGTQQFQAMWFDWKKGETKGILFDGTFAYVHPIPLNVPEKLTKVTFKGSAQVKGRTVLIDAQHIVEGK